MIKYFKIFKKFKSFTFFVTGKCNAKCNFCFYWKNNTLKEDLSLEEIKAISKNLPTFFWLWISGGEPFLRDDLDEICEIFYKNNKVTNIQIPTNGILTQKIVNTTKKILDKCKKANILIIFSIDDYEENHNRVRGVKDCFQKVENSIKELKKIENNRLNLQITSTMTTDNQNNIKNIYKYLRKKFDLAVNVNLVRGETRETKVKDIDIKNYENLHLLIQKDYKKYKHYKILAPFAYAKDTVVRQAVLDTYKKNKRILKCSVIESSLVLDEEGNVFPCEILKNKLGDLKKEKYSQIVKNNKKLLNFIKNKCFCTHECSLTVSILYSMKYFYLFVYFSIKYMLKAK